MSPEYGATCGFFPIDEKSLDYLRMTGRTEEQIELIREYYQAQHMFGMPRAGEIDYSKVVELDLSSLEPSVAGPKRPQDRVALPNRGARFNSLFTAPYAAGGFGLKPEARDHREPVALRELEPAGEHRSGSQELLEDGRAGRTWGETEMTTNRPTDISTNGKLRIPRNGSGEIGHGNIVIAAITSCTNTSNPSVMLGAGLVAKKAVERGLRVPGYVKTSLAPGSREIGRAHV